MSYARAAAAGLLLTIGAPAVGLAQTPSTAADSVLRARRVAFDTLVQGRHVQWRVGAQTRWEHGRLLRVTGDSVVLSDSWSGKPIARALGELTVAEVETPPRRRRWVSKGATAGAVLGGGLMMVAVGNGVSRGGAAILGAMVGAAYGAVGGLAAAFFAQPEWRPLWRAAPVLTAR